MNQRGDTIVEVLFAMVVIGVTIGAAFSISNQALLLGRAAQERSEALKLAESRLELVRIAYKNNSPANIRNRNGAFCIGPQNANPGYVVTGINAASTECKNLDNNGKSGTGGFYNLQLERFNNAYRIQVTWERIAAGTTENLVLWYRPGVL